MFNHPLMQEARIGGTASWLTAMPRRVWNRTGGATLVGGMYAFDYKLTVAAEASANSGGIVLPAVSNYNTGTFTADMASAWNNITLGGGSGDLTKGGRCVALETVADNEPVTVVEVGIVNILMDGATGIAYPNWTPFFAKASSANGDLTLSTVNSLWASSGTAVYKPFGVLLTGYTHTLAGTAQLKQVFFNGWGMMP